MIIRGAILPRAERRGFTLIEILAVLMLLGVVAVFGTQILMTVTRGYVQARNADALAQKAQIALQRMTLDFSYIETATTSGNATSLSYNAGNLGNHAISLRGSNLMYTQDGTAYVLCDGVASGGLQFRYYNNVSSTAETDFNASTTNIISINLTMNGGAAEQLGTHSFTTRVTLNKFNVNSN